MNLGLNNELDSCHVKNVDLFSDLFENWLQQTKVTYLGNWIYYVKRKVMAVGLAGMRICYLSLHI